MAKSNEPLSVRPVKKYRIPKYPSHRDPDPTVGVRYPFRGEFIAAVAAGGLASCLPELPGDGELVIRPLHPAQTQQVKPAQSVETERVPEEEAEPEPDPEPEPEPEPEREPAVPERVPASGNPFRAEYSGLPHHTSPYGTGQPAYLQEKVARVVIERVFQEAGFKLKGPVTYTRDGVEIIADGYDPQAGIGYMFADWRSLGEDTLISWHRRGDHDPRAGTSETAPDPTKLSLHELRLIDRQAEAGKAFMAVISPFDRRFLYDHWIDEATERELEAAYAIRDEKERTATLERLHARSMQTALDRLELEVRNYIAWARAQGL